VRAGILERLVPGLTVQPIVNADMVRALTLFDDGRYDEGFRIVEAEAARGDAEAIFTLADLYWRGQFVVQDYQRGREGFLHASDLGHPIARRAFTNLLASGTVGPRDWPGAMARLREEARRDARRAQMLALIEAMDLTPTGFVGTPPRGERIHDAPQITVFRNLFTPAECDFLIAVAEPTYQESTVVLDSGLDGRNAIRTSDGAPIHWLIEDPAIHALNRRLAAASGTLYDQGEPLLILRYRPGQEYKKHFDALPGVENQRVKTALVYLNEDYEGGETAFTQIGVNFRGRTGDAIVFTNTVDGKHFDPLAEHAGLPVTRGTKYLASRWIRGQRHLPGAR
jgi:prolyl 4-hydroxylase